MKDLLGKRLRAAREQAGLTQQQISERLGFKDRQTLSAIESGKRKVSADELLLAMQILGKDADYFTDPFRLEGEGRFSWRTSAEHVESIDYFESWAGRCIALYRDLATHDDCRTSPMRLGLTNKSSYEDTHRAAEWLVDEWDLGEIPAAKLEDAISERLQALILYIDPPEGISGASCWLPELSAVLINRNETTGRRNFDLAHELFHLLTWDTIEPDHSEYSVEPDVKKRSEQLANCFASALLMPESTVQSWWHRSPRNDEPEWRSWLLDSADALRVTVEALMWRLVQLEMIDKDIIGESKCWSTIRSADEEVPKMFSRDFVNVLKEGLEEGRISVRRAAALVDMTIDDLSDLFLDYSIEAPFEL